MEDLVVLKDKKEQPKEGVGEPSAKSKNTKELNYDEFRASLQRGPLLSVRWHRVILDEAHLIKNHNSRSSMAAAMLKSEYRWALTGTPIRMRSSILTLFL